MTQNEIDVLVVDDEESMRDFLEIVLINEDLNVRIANSGEEAISIIKDEKPRVFIQDLRMGGLDGMELLETAKSLNPLMPIIVITAYSSWDNAVDAMRLGAFDYLKKPFDTEHIRNVVQRALVVSRNSIDNTGLPNRLIVGNTEPMQKLFELIEKVSPTDSTVLIRGESGSGKELVARSIHASSHRRSKPFIAVNCSAFSENLLESELFGHTRGAFTGATENRKGLFVSADGGTLFLDEVADMSASTQVKMLRALEERRVMPVGGSEELDVDVRIVAATNRDLETAISEGEFREDLFYRLNVIPLYLPPLRERKEDIPLLAGHLLAKYAKSMGRPVRRLSEAAQQTLLGYDWPGNVRELDNVIQRHVALCEGESIESIQFSTKNISTPARSSTPGEAIFAVPDQGIDLDDVLEDIERKFLINALEKTGGNLTKAAKILGLSYRSIRYKVKKLGVRDLLPKI